MKPRRGHDGFTLVELLVAAALTAAIAAVILTVTGGALGLWRRAQDNFTADTTALLVLDHLERDFQGALFRPDGGTWLACDGFDTAVASHGWIVDAVGKPADRRYVPAGPAPSIADARFGRSGLWLRLITTTGGAPLAVGYQIVRRSPAGAAAAGDENVRYSLHRVTVTAKNTFGDGYHVPDHEAALRNPEVTYALGTNVVDFGVWLYRRESGGTLVRLYPTSDSESGYAAATAETFPVCADVMIRVLTDEGATRLSALERGLVAAPAGGSGAADEAWWNLVAAHSRVYTRRIEVRGGAW